MKERSQQKVRMEVNVLCSSKVHSMMEWICPTKGQEVTVQNCAVRRQTRWWNWTVFDASTNPGREPLKINIGEGQVIAGWDQGIMAMNLALAWRGEKADLVIKSDYGYGDAGSPPKNPRFLYITVYSWWSWSYFDLYSWAPHNWSIDAKYNWWRGSRKILQISAKNKLSDEKLLEVALIQKFKRMMEMNKLERRISKRLRNTTWRPYLT